MKTMTEEEVEKELATAQELETYEHRNPDDEGDWIEAALYKSKSGRHFRYIESTGMESFYAGAGNIGERLSNEELEAWKKF